jgi:hypothetical protein
MFASQMKKFITVYTGCLLALAVGAMGLLLPGCANIIPPTGGLKDTLAPVLIKHDPPNGTTRFNEKSITLQFDEYVTLDDLQNQLIINPPAEIQPDISARLRTITIKIKDTLQPNTTYSYRFGNAIQDVNESNPIKNYSYVFSTGSYIDSLTLSGVVYNAETGLPDSTMIIMLQKSADDSAVAKEKPQYLTRPNGKGQFLFENLPAGVFYLFALKDEGMRLYSSNRTAFAFWGAPVYTLLPNDSILLRSFIAEKDDPNKAIPTEGDANKKKEEKVLRITPSASITQSQDLLAPFFFNFSVPVKTYDSTKLSFTDTNNVPVKNFQLALDTTALRLKVSTPWKDNQYYRFIYQRNFATDSLGKGNNRADTVVFKTKAESDYGAVKLSFSGLNMARNPLLQWVENDKVVLTTQITGSKLNIALLKPGEYKLRMLYDTNKNGRWDTGDYWKKIQPEMVIAIDQKVSIRPNWESEYEINL